MIHITMHEFEGISTLHDLRKIVGITELWRPDSLVDIAGGNISVSYEENDDE